MSARDLDAALGSAERVLLDSSTLIAFHSPHETAHPLARHVLQRIERDSDPMHGYYSVMSAMELLIRPIRTGLLEFTFMHTFLTAFPHLTALPVDLTVALQAANVRATTNIRGSDAIIIASALLAGCEAIVCNDQRWAARLSGPFPAFTWIYLGQFVS